MFNPKLWVIVLTAMVPAGTHINRDIETTCRNYECVEKMIADAPQHAIARLRVFKPGEYAGVFMSHHTVFPAYMDIEFQ